MFVTLNSGFRKTCSLKTKAFTLIELLVVIAIIALLLSIIVPSLNLAKRKAASAVCLANAKNLSLAWYAYQEENNGQLVSPDTEKLRPGKFQPEWVVNPFKVVGDTITECEPKSGDVTDADEIRGIEKGRLYPYLEDPDVYHCPADNQRKSKFGDYSKIFRTYSMPAGLKSVHKFERMTQPGMRFNFLEESDARNWNWGAWVINTRKIYRQWDWNDPVGYNHGNSGIFGFCDGHAEVHKWQVAYTIERVRLFHESPYQYWGDFNATYDRFSAGAPTDTDNDIDIAYIIQGWADPSANRE